jgi:hypothetical protein
VTEALSDVHIYNILPPVLCWVLYHWQIGTEGTEVDKIHIALDILVCKLDNML